MCQEELLAKIYKQDYKQRGISYFKKNYQLISETIEDANDSIDSIREDEWEQFYYVTVGNFGGRTYWDLSH